MRMTLLRHAEVDKAYRQCYNGHIDIALSDKGHEEARRVALHLAGEEFDAVYCSDLKRTRETLAPLIASSMQPLPVYTDQLREKSWGIHEGMTFDAIVKRDGLRYESFEQWIRALDGEHYDIYIRRISNFFTKFLPSRNYDDVLIVTHAGVIRVLIHLLQAISLEEAFGIDFPYGACTVLDTENWTFGATVCV